MVESTALGPVQSPSPPRRCPFPDLSAPLLSHGAAELPLRGGPHRVVFTQKDGPSGVLHVFVPAGFRVGRPVDGGELRFLSGAPIGLYSLCCSLRVLRWLCRGQ